MNRKNRGRKGATLAEIMVVLAVLVIASAMVVSFSSMMHGAQGVSDARLEALQDVKVAETLIEGFIMNNADKSLVVKDNKLYINDEENPSVFFSTGNVLYVYGNDVMFLESIDAITFDTAQYFDNNEIFTSNSTIFVPSINNPTDDNPIDFTNSDTLYYCTINYSVADTYYTYTFCVNPYVGEEVN